MELAYKFVATNSLGNQVSGVVYAESRDFAWVKLRRANLSPRETKIDIPATLNGIGQKGFVKRDLARFYDTLGKRIDNGRPLAEGFESAGAFVSDPKLRQAIMIVAQSVNDGNKLSEAMRTAGFSYRDAMAIRAAEESGKQGKAFIDLAADVDRKAKLEGQLRAMLMMPQAMLAFLYVASFLGVWLFAPKMEGFLNNIKGTKFNIQDPFQDAYFAASHWVNDNLIMAVALWAAVPALIFWAIKNGHHEKILDKVKSLKMINEKSDMASTWTAFALLYDAGIPPYECAAVVRPSSARESSREMWRQLEKAFLAGHTVGAAVEKAEFPAYIVSGIKAADSSGAPLPEEIQGIAKNLEEDVTVLTKRFQAQAELWSKVAVAAVLFLAAKMTILPFMKMGFQMASIQMGYSFA